MLLVAIDFKRFAAACCAVGNRLFRKILWLLWKGWLVPAGIWWFMI
jgi:hypothetical protein